MRIITSIGFLAAAAGIAYTAFAIDRMRHFRRSHSGDSSAFTPPVSVFKPLHGNEPQLYENLRTFCDQDYPQYQLIFGADDPNDPALAVAQRLQREYPERDIIVDAGTRTTLRNPKVANLLAMSGRARYPIFAIADSDMRVGRDYLQAVAAPFADDSVGAVTCIYGGMPNSHVTSQIGAMHINDYFSPSVLVATALEPLTYCFGATMAVRRDVLENAGGFEALGDHLGDDYALGKLVVNSGRRVSLSNYVVHTTVSDNDLRTLWLHELRWARTILAQRPAGFAGSIVMYALPLAVTYAALAPSALAFFMVACATTLRTIAHYEGRKTFAPQLRATPWLIPARDFLSVVIWATAFLGKRVRWRDSHFEVKAGGQMAGAE